MAYRIAASGPEATAQPGCLSQEIQKFLRPSFLCYFLFNHSGRQRALTQRER